MRWRTWCPQCQANHVVDIQNMCVATVSLAEVCWIWQVGMCRCLCCSSFVLHVIYFLLSSKSNLASSIKLSPNSIMMGLFTCMYFGLARESLRVWFHDLSLYPSILAYHKLSISSLTNESLDVGGKWVPNTESRYWDMLMQKCMVLRKQEEQTSWAGGPPFLSL